MRPQDDPNRARFRPLSNSRQFRVLRDLGTADELFEYRETSFLDEASGSPVTTEQATVHRANCGHVVVDVMQVTRCTKCESEVCGACQVRCARCLAICCTSCVDWLRGQLVCHRCQFLRGLWLLLKDLGVGLFKVLGGILKVLPRALLALHRLLSKEF